MRQRRPNPEVLAAGDILQIPESQPTRNPLRLGSTNSFSVRLPTVKLELTVNGSDGQPLANKRYWVDGEDAGSTDGAGKVQIEVRPTVPSILLRVEGLSDTLLLRVAHLDPIDTDDGVRQRLTNLHYLPDDATCVTEESVAEALRRFQQVMGLEVTGTANQATRERLVSSHGS
ncbi:MAG: peptidoglycan-binding domain-containing protein [Polyangiaceae bacterium]